MSRRIKLSALACLLCGLPLLAALPQLLDVARAAVKDAAGQPPPPAAEAVDCGTVPPMPLPSTFLPARLPQYQEQLARFLQCKQYAKLGWAEDKGIRDTGPFFNNNH